MFEHHRQPLLPRSAFLLRLARYGAIVLLVIFGSLVIGMVGYHTLEGLAWIDAFVNAAMILGGMGPVNPLATNAAKMFASGYALFSGLVFIAIMGIVLAPLTHRMLHKFHIDEKDLE